MNAVAVQIGPQVQAQAQAPWLSWLVGEGWNIVNLDKREYVLFQTPPEEREHTDALAWHAPPHSFETLSTIGYEFNDIMWTLIEPVMLSMAEILPQHKPKPMNSTSGESSAHGMHTLPVDVKLLVFEAIDSLRDATALCLTNSAMLSAGRRRVEKLSKLKWATWLGDRIVALPGRTDADFWEDTDALPACLSGDSDLAADVVAAGGFACYLHTYTPCRRVRCPPSLPELRHDRPAFDWARFGGASLCHYPLAARWLVCNLSRRQYVRMPPVGPAGGADAGADASDASDDPHERGMGMWAARSHLPAAAGRSVPARISCSSARRGPWAGERLAIRTYDAARAAHGDWDLWEDVTSPEDPIRLPRRGSFSFFGVVG